jgi:hypothetical protein
LSGITRASIAPPAARRASAASRPAAPPLSVRRRLQLALAALWLFDGVLQLQPYMFTKSFAQNIIAPAAAGNPAVIADPMTWAARIIAAHPAPANAAFAAIQLALGLGIAWRPTARAALACSIGWALGVWWFGEGLGGVLTGSDPLMGAPGVVILYALLAVLLWPSERPAPFPAAAAVGTRAAQALWLVLWGSGAYLVMQTANTGPNDMHDMIAGMAGGQPRWLSWTDGRAAALVADRGMAASVVLAVVLAAIALAVCLPAGPAQRATFVTALIVALVIWVVGEALGMVIGGQGTDPNTGPLLMLIVAAYWPTRAAGPKSDQDGAA